MSMGRKLKHGLNFGPSTWPIDDYRICEDRPVKVGTPFGEFPFEYRRIERREDGVAIVGLVAGLESRVVLDKGDARRAAIALAVPAAAVSLLLLARAAGLKNR
jgi:hypothetical protein